MGVGRAGIALLVAAEAHAAAAGTADVAGRERHVHQRAVGAVVVVAPDQALLVGEHRAAPGTAGLRLRDPLRRLADLVDRQPGDRAPPLRGVVLLPATALSKSFGRGRDEGLVDPALLGDVGQPGVEQREVGARS